MAYVIGFILSCYSNTIVRISKPYDPVLGETFEFNDEERNYKYIAE
jgi:hypothetical protein